MQHRIFTASSDLSCVWAILDQTPAVALKLFDVMKNLIAMANSAEFRHIQNIFIYVQYSALFSMRMMEGHVFSEVLVCTAPLNAMNVIYNLVQGSHLHGTDPISKPENARQNQKRETKKSIRQRVLAFPCFRSGFQAIDQS